MAKRKVGAVIFLCPALTLLGIFAVFPIFYAVVLSFTDAELLRPDFHWVGLRNFKDLLLGGRLFTATKATLLFVGGSVLLQFLMGLLGALSLHLARFRSVRFFRSGLVLPYTLSELVVAVLWGNILDSEFGVANTLIMAAGGPAQAWLHDWAMPAAIVANVWWGSAFSLLLFEAALKNIPADWYESATVDGAGRLFQLRHITLPSLKYVAFLDLVYITLFTLNTFGILFVLTFGGPSHSTEVLGLFMWKTAFRDYKLGYGAAISVILLSLNLMLTLIYLKLFGRGVLTEERY